MATLVAMFPLIWFGGLTTSHGAGLAVPDWPNTYGYNMFAVPFSVWLSESAGGIFLEHTHRLLGSLTGMLAVAATLWAWAPSRGFSARRWWGRLALILLALAIASFVLMRLDVGGRHRDLGHAASLFGGLGVIAVFGWLARMREPRRWVRWATTALLGAIIVQGVLGGLRVTEVNLELAIIHGVFAQVAFCFTGFLVLVTGASWDRLNTHIPAAHDRRHRRLLYISAAITVLLFAQLVVAAMMRHYQAGLAVPDFPLTYGRVLPPVSTAGFERANEIRAFDLSLPPTSLAMIWLHSAHRIGAIVITLAFGCLAWESARLPRDRRAWLVALLGVLLAVQVSLGVATVWMRKPADIATAHVAVGALLLLIASQLTIRLLQSASAGRRSREGASSPARADPRQSAARLVERARLSH